MGRVNGTWDYFLRFQERDLVTGFPPVMQTGERWTSFQVTAERLGECWGYLACSFLVHWAFPVLQTSLVLPSFLVLRASSARTFLASLGALCSASEDYQVAFLIPGCSFVETTSLVQVEVVHLVPYLEILASFADSLMAYQVHSDRLGLVVRPVKAACSVCVEVQEIVPTAGWGFCQS